MKLTKEFNTRLMALKTSGKKAQYTQASTVLVEMEMSSGTSVSKNFRSEGRIPNCFKYELPDGYRIVFQKIEGLENEFLALFVGSHDEVDHFLNSHKGWIFDSDRHTLRELRWDTAKEEASNSVRSPELKSASPVPDKQPVFSALTDEQLIAAGVPDSELSPARSLDDPDSLDVMKFFDRLPEDASSILLAFATGSANQRQEIDALLCKKRELVVAPDTRHLVALESNSDIFVDLKDLPEEKRAFEQLPFEDWMLYLHPDQKALVRRSFTAPARLRGVSGSGKTVIAIHRAREAARHILTSGTNARVLILTYNRSLCELMERLLRKLCTASEFDKIEVWTVGKWCQDFIRFRTGAPVGWQDSVIEATWLSVLKRFLPQLHRANFCMDVVSIDRLTPRNKDIQFLAEEIDFIYGKFLHPESNGYMGVERHGRGRRLGPNQRTLVLDIYKTFVQELAKAKMRDSRELARVACSLLEKGEIQEHNYSAVIVDEVQDLSDIELRIIKSLGEQGGSLFLVGDGAQQIYKRGQSLKGIGIDISGRSFIIRKNYRNTAEIMKAAMALKRSEGIGRFDEDPVASQEEAVLSAVSGERPAILVCKSQEQERQLVVREVRYLIKRLGFAPSEICCMSRSAPARKSLVAALGDAGIKALDYRADGVGSDDAVLVSTLHNAKGHEFRAVFILTVTEGMLPHFTASDVEDVEREAALLYVAMTRSKELLYLSHSVMNDARKPLNKSRFLDDMAGTVDVLDFTRS